MIHERESTQDTEQHLSENREAFESDCVFLLRLMMRGKRLTSQDVHDMKIHDRRLRNLFESGKCEREWMFNDKGKRTHVEYFIKAAKPPTKQSVQEWWSNFQEEQPLPNLIQGSFFPTT